MGHPPGGVGVVVVVVGPVVVVFVVGPVVVVVVVVPGEGGADVGG